MAKKKLQAQRPSRNESFLSGTMDELLERSDQDVQLLLREVDQKDLLIGLMGSSQEVRDKVLGNMSERVRNYLEGEMEVFQKQFAEMSSEDVEDIQKRIMAELGKPRPKLSKRYLSWKAKLEKSIRGTPSGQMDFDQLRDMLTGSADVARHEGLLELSSVSGEPMEGFLQRGILYVVDGNPEDFVSELLEAHMQALLRHQEIHYRMIITAVMAIQSGEHPNLVAERLNSLYYQPPTPVS